MLAMKLRFLIVPVLLGALFAGKSEAQQQEKKAPKPSGDPFVKEGPIQVSTQLEYIELSHEDLTRLLFMRRLKGDATELRKEVQKMVSEKKAQIMETALIVNHSETSATVSSAKEYTWPSEYEPPELPNSIRLGDGKIEGNAPIEVKIATPATPTAFETTKLGLQLDVKSAYDAEARVVDLQVDSNLVYHAGNVVWSEWKGMRGDGSIRMASFYKLELTTQLSVHSGKYALLAVQSPKKENGEIDSSKKMMVFVKCDVMDFVSKK